MGKLNKKEMIISYTVLGLSLGLIILFLIYVVLFNAMEETFTFSLFGKFHRQLWFLYLCDMLPPLSAFMGALAGRRRYEQLDTYARRIQNESEKNQEIKRFTDALIAGDLNTSYSNEGTDKALAESLNKLRDTLVKNREAERQLRLKERQRNWVSQGLAEFGDILRTHSTSLESMSYAVVSGLVRYLGANQGAIYIPNKEASELEMIACHAYERKKFPDKKIPWGEGLIGAVAMEMKNFYTDKIPDTYLTITSGLGKANPNHLLIEPLIWDKKLFGIVEIASFKNMEQYQLQFVARVAENIATTIHTIESKDKTELLLLETQAQAARLEKQEEQVRHNMEALKQAQEEAARHAETFINFTNTVNHTLMRAEYDTDGKLLYANTRFLKKLGYQGYREVNGKHISIFINEKERKWFDEMWDKLARGGRHYEGYMKHETKLGQDLWTMATYTCVRNEEGEVEKILFLAFDSTEQKKQSLDFEGQIEAIDRLSAKAVFTPGGKIISSNELFCKAFKYNDIELMQKNVFDFFGAEEQERFTEIWEKVIRGEAFQGQLKMHSNFEENLWFRATFLSANDMYGEVEKVIFLANEVTREKEMELASRKNHEQLVRKEEELRFASIDLKKKLEDTNELRRKDQARFKNEVKQYIHILEELPHGVITINNLGYILFFNRGAEKMWGLKEKDVAGSMVDTLFDQDPGSDVVSSFCDPARRKLTGMHAGQQLHMAGGKEISTDILVIRTELQDKLNYTMLIFSPD